MGANRLTDHANRDTYRSERGSMKEFAKTILFVAAIVVGSLGLLVLIGMVAVMLHG